MSKDFVYCGLPESPVEMMFYGQALLMGVDIFTPQHRAGNYRLDFAYIPLMIGVEIDGHDYHKTKEQRTSDAKRDRKLAEMGWHIIRFTGSEVYTNPKECVRDVLRVMLSKLEEKGEGQG